MSNKIVGQYWKHLPGKMHLSDNCTVAFNEAPARWKVERMQTIVLNRSSARKSTGFCPECFYNYMRAKHENDIHERQRKQEMVDRAVARFFRG